jgi:hypothetical protein
MASKYQFRSTTLSVRKISDIMALERIGEDKIDEYELPAIQEEKKRRVAKKTGESVLRNLNEAKPRVKRGTRFGGRLFERRNVSTQTDMEVNNLQVSI